MVDYIYQWQKQDNSPWNYEWITLTCTLPTLGWSIPRPSTYHCAWRRKELFCSNIKTNFDILHISTKSVTVEAAHSLSLGERYHDRLQRAIFLINQEAPTVTDTEGLRMAVKGLNDSVDSDEIVPTLPVYGTLSGLGFPSDPPSPSTHWPATKFRKATETTIRHVSKWQIRNALVTWNSPDVTNIQKTPTGFPVLVYRPQLDRWDGPYCLLDIKGEYLTVMLLPTSGPAEFRSTVVKTLLVENKQSETEQPAFCAQEVNALVNHSYLSHAHDHENMTANNTTSWPSIVS